VHVHGAGLDVGLSLPDDLQELRTGLHPAPALDQSQQELVLGGGQAELPSVQCRSVGRTVNRYRAG
jgi:hypothetical protein